MLTLVFERTPLDASIQMYSAMILPRWGRSMYFLRFSVLEMCVDEGAYDR